jgi:hypothetical protein
MQPKPTRAIDKSSLNRVIDRVWVHMRNERFTARRRSKLHPKGYGPFQVLERVNDNAYKLNFPGEYNISAMFNVFDLSLFDVSDDSRSNHIEERGMMRINKYH